MSSYKLVYSMAMSFIHGSDAKVLLFSSTASNWYQYLLVAFTGFLCPGAMHRSLVYSHGPCAKQRYWVTILWVSSGNSFGIYVASNKAVLYHHQSYFSLNFALPHARWWNEYFTGNRSLCVFVLINNFNLNFIFLVMEILEWLRLFYRTSLS